MTMTTSITHAHLDWNESGTPVSDQFDDVYFSNVNGLDETRYVFLTQNQLPTRWEHYQHPRFVVAETGFGTGLNFLALWQWFEAFRQNNPEAPLQSLHFISFEKYPLTKDDLIKAHQAWPELAEYATQLQDQYPLAIPECHRMIFADGLITVDLWFGDIKTCLPSVPTPEHGLVDAWFLDGFAPSKNPDMWSQDLFNGMVQLAKQDCSVATFTAAGFVRRGLIEAGFDMKKVKGFGTKRDMIVGHLAHKTPYTNIHPWFAHQGTDNLHDVAIIGGGIASACLANALIHRGISVTLYCQDEKPACGASGNRQGALYPLLNGNHDDVSRVFAPAFVFARQFLNQAAQHFDFAHSWCGVTQLMWDEKSAKKLHRLLQDQFDPNLVHGLNAQETDAITKQHIGLPSVHYPLGGWLSPEQLTTGLLQHLQQRGLVVHYQCPIQSLDWQEDSQHWHLDDGSTTRPHQAVVIATGHQFDHFTQTQDLPLGKVKGQVSHVPTNDTLTELQTVLCYDGYMAPADPVTQTHCIGASYHRNQTDTTFEPQAQIDNVKRLRHCVPQPWTETVDSSDNWSRQGVRCVSRDHLPFVGNIGRFSHIMADYADLHTMAPQDVKPVASYPNLYAFLGLGARGLTSAPLLGEALASQMCQQPMPFPVDVLETLHPSRMWVRKLKKGKAIVRRSRSSHK